MPRNEYRPNRGASAQSDGNSGVMARGIVGARRVGIRGEARVMLHLAAPKAFFVSQEVLAGTAIIALASHILLGALGVMMFILATSMLIAIRPGFQLKQLLIFAPLLILPLLAVASTMWSDAPQLSMRTGLELLLTFVASIIICRNLRPERMILCAFLVFFLLALSTLPYIPSSIAANYPLTGMLGNKNQVGFVGYMLFVLSLAIIVDRQQWIAFRLGTICAVPVALVLIVMSQSGGTTSSVVLALILFPPLAMLGAFKPSVRIPIVILAVLLLFLCSFFIDDITAAITDFRVNVLKKDATLTGRTYLWDFADRLSASRPYLGYGYSAFWRQGNVDAEGLWRWGGIISRSGFNFHNEFIGMRVDLGLVGLTILIANCVVIAVLGFARQIVRPTVPMACLIALTCVNYSRAYVEQGLVAPFGLITLIWLATAVYAFGTVGDEDKHPFRPRSNANAIPKREGHGWQGVSGSRADLKRPRARNMHEGDLDQY